ncbi:MAG: ABC transporter permease [Deltaproteobacteria bacterium]|nr:ABC transporter permease [Deltaproteobacteria bacterium]
MFRYLRLAVRNVLRSRARSALTISAIAFGVWMTLVLGAFIAGMQNAMIDDTVKGRVGAIQIHRKGYDDVLGDQPLDLDLPQDAPWLDKVRKTPGVVAVAPRISFTGILTNGSQSANYVGVGVDPKLDQLALPLFAQSVKGHIVGDDPEQSAAIVVGDEMGVALHAEPGATLTLQAATASGQQNAMDAVVVGARSAGTPFDNKRLVFVPLAWAQELLNMEGRVSGFVVAVDDREKVRAIAEQLQRELGPELKVEPWQDLASQVADVVRVQRIILGGIGAVFLIIAIIGVANTMLMSVLERTREIGTMMALGVRRRTITLLFLLEGMTLALFGGGVGIGLAVLLAKVVGAAGGVSGSPPGTVAKYAIIPDLPLWLIAPTVALTLLGTLAAAGWPAWRASRLRPVEALRAT